MRPHVARPKLRDVARALGVSITTVSNAFNRPDQLSEALRGHVLAQAESMGYRGPGAEGRLLRTGHAGAIALYQCEPLQYALGDPYAAAFVGGVAAICQDRQVGLLLLPAIPRDRGAGGRLPAAIDVAAVDGFILYCLTDDDPAVRRTLDRGRPVVGVDMEAHKGIITVTVDDRGGAAMAMRHLLGLGHRRIGVISFPLDPGRRPGPVGREAGLTAAFGTTRRRWHGYADAEAEAGPVHIVGEAVAANERADGAAAASTLLRTSPRPSAVVAMSDVLALGALDACRRLGLAVPDDVAVVGFDDVAEATTAGLTTIRQDPVAKGRAAVAALLDGEATDKVQPVDFVRRGSA